MGGRRWPVADGFRHPTALVESPHVGAGARVFAYSHVMAGARLGENASLGDHVFVEGGASIGANVTVKNGVQVWEGVTIEDDAFVGPNVTFTNDRFPRSPRMPLAAERYADRANWLVPTRVGRGASIGANATILAGVTLGAYAMVAAGAVVTRDVPAFALVAGSPARRVGDVCRCGQKLPSSYETADCPACGETPATRLALEAVASPP